MHYWCLFPLLNHGFYGSHNRGFIELAFSISWSGVVLSSKLSFTATIFRGSGS
jgi:hypothetical protein